MARSEPAWASKLYEVFGLALIGVVGVVIWFVAKNFEIIIGIAVFATGYYFYRRHKADVDRRAEASELYQAIKATIERQQFPDADTFANHVVDLLLEQGYIPHFHIAAAILNATHDIYAEEGIADFAAPVHLYGTIEHARWIDMARARLRALSQPDVIGTLEGALFAAYSSFFDTLPRAARSDPETFSEEARRWKLANQTESEVPPAPTEPVVTSHEPVTSFSALTDFDSQLSKTGLHAEQALTISPEAGANLLRTWLQLALRRIETAHGLERLPDNSSFIRDSIDRLHEHQVIPDSLIRDFNRIRGSGNKGTHALEVSKQEASAAFSSAYRICDWMLTGVAAKPTVTRAAPDARFTISLTTLLLNEGKSVEELCLPFFVADWKPLFARLCSTIDSNQRSAGCMPSEFRGPHAARTFLRNTPLLKLFEAVLPIELPQPTRFSGHWIVAPPNRGKTTLLSAMFLEDLHRDASIIVMDSKGELLDPIRKLDGIQDRLVILDPSLEHPLALNPLDLGADALSGSETTRKMLVNRKVSYLEALFGGMLEAGMTPLQSRYFRIVLRAIMLAAHEPTLATFRDIAQGGYQGHLQLERLDEDDRSFFLKEFDGKTYKETRQQVLWRLGLLFDDPVFKAMFTAPKTKVDMADLMDSGKIILINNSKAELEEGGSEFFGRYFLALVRSAAQQRAKRHQDDKLPVYFYIDECQTVIRQDDNIATIIDECRSQNIAMIMAHQRLNQITSSNVLDALSNCAIRFANSDNDAGSLASLLRTDEDFLHQPQGSFAAFIRDKTDTAISIKVPLIKLRELPQMSARDQQAVTARMRSQYCVSDRPIVNLHKPDLPWKLEPPDEPTSGPVKY